jgi:excisionase family DNA binding protein
MDDLVSVDTAETAAAGSRRADPSDPLDAIKGRCAPAARLSRYVTTPCNRGQEVAAASALRCESPTRGETCPTSTTARHLSIDELADRLGITVRHVRRLVAQRRVPYLKVGRLVRFDPVEIAEWLDTRHRPQVGARQSHRQSRWRSLMRKVTRPRLILRRGHQRLRRRTWWPGAQLNSALRRHALRPP